ncbi:MAG TPA: HAMP domain-containing sensor histidine kinase, partial [Nitrospira sp.]|nr:HAMP domain-containing sensor histidine kinase [Nitrospira sp.]
VAIAASADGDRVRVEVRDDGPGVPPELREKIFTPFFTTREKGTGLGLAICAWIADLHKGRVEVKSDFGQGSTFTVVLPLAHPAA